MPTTKATGVFLVQDPMTSGELTLVVVGVILSIFAFWWAMGIERRREERKAQTEKDRAYLSKHKLVLGERVSILDEDGNACTSGELLKVSRGNAVVRIKKEKQHIPLVHVIPFRRLYMRGSLN